MKLPKLAPMECVFTQLFYCKLLLSILLYVIIQYSIIGVFKFYY